MKLKKKIVMVAICLCLLVPCVALAAEYTIDLTISKTFLGEYKATAKSMGSTVYKTTVTIVNGNSITGYSEISKAGSVSTSTLLKSTRAEGCAFADTGKKTMYKSY